jgi:hypothetical protein
VAQMLVLTFFCNSKDSKQKTERKIVKEIRSSKNVNGTHALGVFLVDAFMSEQQQPMKVTTYLNITALGAKNDLSAAALIVFADSNWPPANQTSCRSIVQGANFAISLTKITRAIQSVGSYTMGLANVKRDTYFYFLVADCIANAVNNFYWEATLASTPN